MSLIFRPAASLLVIFTILTGVVYPLAMTGLIQIAMPDRANGSLVRKGETVVGSALIGQRFDGDRYFHSRPSAAGKNGYDAAASSGSNLGPLSVKLHDRIGASLAALMSTDQTRVSADAVTTSASGLDPHISIAFAQRQLSRVARARNVERSRLQALLDQISEQPDLGFIGEPRVNVLMLNLALDAEMGRGAS